MRTVAMVSKTTTTVMPTMATTVPMRMVVSKVLRRSN